MDKCVTDLGIKIQIDDPRLDIALSSAVQAGNAAMSVKKTTEQKRKEDDSVVTVADRDAEQTIRDRIAMDSDLPILGEEYGGDLADSDSYWVVDPIDGTHNFASEHPVYGSAVALVEDDEPTVGVFYMPELEYLFYAVSEQGAYRNETQLEVSKDTETQGGKIGLSGRGRQEMFPEVAQLNSRVQIIGCAVAVEGWVGSGWYNSAVFGAFAPWDMAVGTVLVREAGGVLQHLESGAEDWDSIKSGRVVMGNRHLVESIRSQISEEGVTAAKNATYEY